MGPSAPIPEAQWWRRSIWRVLLGCIVVLFASAGATAVAVVEQVNTIVQDISVTKPLTVNPRVLAQTSFGQPETLLMVGDDTRSVYKYYTGYVPNLANEMLLVRIDPSTPWISMMSIPRELWVNITEPDGATYTNRLNSAYTFGTTTLVKTIKQVTGLSVNHVIATTFTQFEAAINQLGCIYDTIDERYYNLNDGVPGTDYQSVNLLPGYQCLSGSQAEQFVSYRHTDSSQVRDARDQSFLLAVKAQYGPELSGNIGRFEKIFGQTVQTDPGLRSTSEILNLADLLISAAGLRVRQVPFQASTCPVGVCPAGDLTASPQQIDDSVQSFLHGTDVQPKGQVATISHRVAGHGTLASLGLTPTLDTNLADERALAARLPFTAEFPRFQDLSGTALPIEPTCTAQTGPCLRSYKVRAPDGHVYPIYVEVFSNGDLGQFYDVQGTTWTSAPLFNHPDQTVEVGKRTYELFYNGSHIETVAWRQFGAVYWVHNTLTEAVGNSELLAIAEHTARVGPLRVVPSDVAAEPSAVPATHPTTLPAPLNTGMPLVEEIGRVGGLVTLVLLPLGLILAFLNWRRLRTLRGHVHAAAVNAVSLENRLTSFSPGYPGYPGSGPVLAPAGAGQAAYAARGSRPAEYEGPIRPRRSRGAQIGLVGAAIVLLTAAVVAAVLVHDSNSSDRRGATAAVPTAKVAVLNAGRTLTAAHALAVKLAQERVHVVSIGVLEASAPTSYEVLYTPGEAAQARLLARLLKAHHPVVAAVNPATRRTLGSQTRLVVVIP